MHLLTRAALAGGAVLAATVALTGTGTFASFTSSVSADNSFKTGTFQLEALPTGTPTVSGPLIGDANPTGQPKQGDSATPEPAVTGEGNTLSYSLANASPGDTYTYEFTTYDVGTLQGQINTITYQPGSEGRPLLNDMTVEVQEQVNGVWTPIHTTTGNGAPGVPENANGAYTFYLDYSFGPAFLQPNTLVNGKPTWTGDGELGATFRVVFSINESAGNSVEGMKAAPQVMVNGVVTP